MKYLLSIGVSVLLATTVVVAQTPGTGNIAGAEFEMVTAINAGVADATDKAAVDGDLVTVGMSSPDTTLVGEPLILAAGLAPAGSDPTLPFGMEGNIIGIPFSPYEATILLDGFAPVPFPPVVGFGSTDIGIPIPGQALCFLGMDGIYFQSAAADATKPNGIAFSVALEVAVSPVKTTSLTLGDDDDTQVVLTVTSVNFYGTVYSDFYVGSNGFVTFGAGDTAFSTSETSMLADEPRVAPLWTDLSPQNGAVIVSETCGGDVVVDYDAPSYLGSTGGGGPNLYSTVLSPTGDVLFAWSVVTADAPNFNNDDMTGISPGGGLSLPNDVGVFSALTAPVVGTSFQALYHNYDDLCGDDAEELAGGMASFTFDGVDAYTLNATVSTLPASPSGLSPSSGPEAGGTLVTISGCSFDSMNTYTVDFVGAGVVPAMFIDTQTLDCVTPAGLGTVDVAVLENGSPIGTLTAAFTFVPSGGFNGPTPDDGNVNIVLNGPATFYGVGYTDLFVNSNGNVTFGSSDSDFSESESEMLADQPRIAPHWDDMNPSSGGLIGGVDNPATFTVTWLDVPAYTTGANGSTLTIDKATGEITLTYQATCTSWNGGVSTRNVLAGISPGGGALLVPVDLSTNSGAVAGPTDALFEWFNSTSFSLGNFPWDLDAATFGFTPSGGGYVHHNP